MKDQRRCYRCSKPLVLGSLYDVMEKTKWKLISANSDEGILLVQEPSAGIRFVIHVCPGAAQTVELSVMLASGEFSGWSMTENSINRLLQALDVILAAVSVQQVPLNEKE